MMHTVIYLEGTGLANTIGRFDQYMYPFYKADLENGTFTKGEIQELIENFYINLNDNIFLYDFSVSHCIGRVHPIPGDFFSRSR